MDVTACSAKTGEPRCLAWPSHRHQPVSRVGLRASDNRSWAVTVMREPRYIKTVDHYRIKARFKVNLI